MVGIFGLRCPRASLFRVTCLAAGVIGLSSSADATSSQRGMIVGAVVVAPCQIDRNNVRCARGEHYGIDVHADRLPQVANGVGSWEVAPDREQHILVREVIF